MPVVHLAPIPGYEGYYNLTAIGSGSAPPRPTPGPTPPNWGPEVPTHPIANPSPPYVDIAPPGLQPGGNLGVQATIIPLPETSPPTPPPAGMPPDSKHVMLWFGPGTQPASAWVAPYVSTGPVAAPPAAQPQKK